MGGSEGDKAEAERILCVAALPWMARHRKYHMGAWHAAVEASVQTQEVASGEAVWASSGCEDPVDAPSAYMQF